MEKQTSSRPAKQALRPSKAAAAEAEAEKPAGPKATPAPASPRGAHPNRCN